MIVNLTNIRMDATMNAPASVMARGLAVVKDGATIDEVATTERPYGFLATEVTADGLSYLELETIKHAEVEETKVSVGKVAVILWEPGEIATDNIKAAEVWAVGELVAAGADGVLTVDAPATGDHFIGIVKEINASYGAATGLVVITLSHDLGVSA